MLKHFINFINFLILQNIFQNINNCLEQVTNLNVITNYNNIWYSGYLQVQALDQEYQIHYILFPSQNSSSDPFIIQLGYGPNCSIMSTAFNGNGPFKFDQQGTDNFISNEHSWNKNNQVLYIDLPGVGFSKSNKIFYIFDDDKVALLYLEILKVFMQQNTTYKSLNMYLSGEGYGSASVIRLVQNIIQHNTDNPSNLINLKGIILGNPCISDNDCNFKIPFPNSLFQTLDNMGFIKQSQRDTYILNCETFEQKQTLLCYNEFKQILDTIQQNLNMYNLKSQCYHQDKINNVDKTYGPDQWTNNKNWLYEIFRDYDLNIAPEDLQAFENTIEKLKIYISPPAQQVYDKLQDAKNCTDQSRIQQFLNTQSNKQALNIDDTILWQSCSKIVSKFYVRKEPLFQYFQDTLINQNLKILVYSGLNDGVVPTLDTNIWIQSLEDNQFITSSQSYFKNWYNPGKSSELSNKQVAGQYKKYDKLIYAKVIGAGHQAYIDTPQSSQNMIDLFINNNDLE